MFVMHNYRLRLSSAGMDEVYSSGRGECFDGFKRGLNAIETENEKTGTITLRFSSSREIKTRDITQKLEEQGLKIRILEFSEVVL